MGRADYLRDGDWNAICDECGKKFKASQLKLRWDGFMVCQRDWEPRHPQDFVRGVKDTMNTPWSRTNPEVNFGDVSLTFADALSFFETQLFIKNYDKHVVGAIDKITVVESFNISKLARITFTEFININELFNKSIGRTPTDSSIGITDSISTTIVPEVCTSITRQGIADIGTANCAQANYDWNFGLNTHLFDSMFFYELVTIVSTFTCTVTSKLPKADIGSANCATCI